MTALAVIQKSLCVSFLAAAVVAVAVKYLLYRHLRRHQREAFDKLRIHSPSFLWREDRDAESTAFEDFFSSGRHEALNDLRLKALLRLNGVTLRACGLSLAFLIITFLAFRADPGHVWNFLLDLAHY
jgi:hypothetical protein